MIVMDSLLRKTQTAELNSVLAIAVVFCVLILISFIISLFQNIAKAQNAIANKKISKMTERTIVHESINQTIEQIIIKEEQELEPMVEEVIPDYELIAVISAAIAAATDTTTDEFVVKSIKKVNKSNWHRA